MNGPLAIASFAIASAHNGYGTAFKTLSDPRVTGTYKSGSHPP